MTAWRVWNARLRLTVYTPLSSQVSASMVPSGKTMLEGSISATQLPIGRFG